MSIYKGNQLIRDILGALGLKGVRDFSIHFPLGGIATVRAEFLLPHEKEAELRAVIRKYRLSAEEVVADESHDGEQVL